MIRRRLNYRYFWLRVGMFLLPTLAFAIAAYIRFASTIVPVISTDIDPTPYFELVFFTTVVWAIAVEHHGLCKIGELTSPSRRVTGLLWAWGTTYMTVMAATFLYRHPFSRVMVLLSAAVLLLLALIMYTVFERALAPKRRGDVGTVRILIVGTDLFAQQVAEYLSEGTVMPCNVVGFVRLPSLEVTVTDSPVFELEGIEAQLKDTEIDEVILALPPTRIAEISEIAAQFEFLSLPVRAVLDFGESVLVREQVFEFGRLQMLDLRATPAESIMYLVIKRAFDLTFSTLVIVVAAPLMALIALAIRLSSAGPIIFTQDRVGLNGQIFKMYKFRTMRVSDPTESDLRWTTANDPRRTMVGTFLRRSNLDELPQFFNVLKGEMSVVGPRPERPFFVRKFLQDIAKYSVRHYLKVGITGWAQVNGLRGDTSITERVEHDLYYLRNWSLALDMQIILLTVLRAFSSKNAY